MFAVCKYIHHRHYMYAVETLDITNTFFTGNVYHVYRVNTGNIPCIQLHLHLHDRLCLNSATPGPDVHLGGPPVRGEKTLPRSRQMVRLNRAAHYCQMAASWDHPVADRNKAIAISPGGPKS
ncbi:hypothetical protein M514_14087 [Trichuris suis]|uniref:Uncharacterized protein n=1 Tax=Trichuris suis TaxID=68888 RepID=A0A085MZ14_9BILA|nr:hypothetical protein M514_14087 [Trichuris suis]